MRLAQEGRNETNGVVVERHDGQHVYFAILLQDSGNYNAFLHSQNELISLLIVVANWVR
jgi:hypothetical protein